MGKLDTLRGMGLLNQDTSYEELVTTQKQNHRVGFCTSRTCNKNGSNMGVAKLKAKGDQCPDCSNFLLWRSLTFDQYSQILEKGTYNYAAHKKRYKREKPSRKNNGNK